MEWEMEKPASTVAALVSSEMQELPTEVLRIDATTAAIVVEIDGADYILTVTRAPQQRARMAPN